MDDLLAIRRAILTALADDAAITALVPAARIYPQAAPVPAPAWPFIIYGAPTGVPIRAACVRGTEVTVAIHSFALPRKEGAQTVETAEDYASRIGRAVVLALDGKRIDLERGYVSLLFTGSQLLIDGGEKDAFHHIANLRARAITS